MWARASILKTSVIFAFKGVDKVLKTANRLVNKYFSGSVDKAGKPYINHLTTVAEQVYLVKEED